MNNPPFLAIMSKSKRYNKILNKIVNINEDCSEDTSEEDQYELGQSEADSESSEYIESEEIEGSSDSKEEHFLKVCRNKKRMRILLVLTPRMKGQAFQSYPKM